MEIKNDIVTRIDDIYCNYNEINIPDGITAIGDYAAHNINISKVVLPNSVTEIGDAAFCECQDLEEIILSDSITKIGSRAFSNCKNLKRIVLPNNLQYLGHGAFSGCENLEEIILPSSIKEINFRTFADCNKLKKIIIPEGVETICWGAFCGCDNLEEIVLPNSIKNLENQIFMSCTNLKKVILPNSIDELPNDFFRNCSNLDIELPNNITKLNNNVFENCVSLTNFPTNVIEFGNNCFRNCKSLKKVVLNPSVLTLAEGMFYDCVELTDICSVNKSLTIGGNCFKNCKSLTTIPSFVKKLEMFAFEGCEGLQEITIHDEFIPFGCFKDCINLKKINHRNEIIAIEDFAFLGCSNLEEIELSLIEKIPTGAFNGCKKLSKVKINGNIKEIGKRAFYKCESLKDFVIPDSVTKIGKEAFKYCNSIKQINISKNLTSLDVGAFASMSSLENVCVSSDNEFFITPDNKCLINQRQQKLVLYAAGCKDKSYSLKKYNIKMKVNNTSHEVIRPITYIDCFAFAGAKNLEELTICSCTSDIEYNAFVDCPNLKKLTIKTIPFYSTHGFILRNNGDVFLGDEILEKNFLPFEVIRYCPGIVCIENNALSNFKNVKKIILPKYGNYKIGNMAFGDCINLDECDIPLNVVSIGRWAFPAKTKVKFNNGISGTNFIELAHSDKFIGEHKLYTFDDNDGKYFIEQNNKITTITKKKIDKICSHSSEIRENPILFLDFMNDLVKHNLDIDLLHNGILMANMSLENRKILFDNFSCGDEFFKKVLIHSGILDKKDNETDFLLSKENFDLVVTFVNILKKHNIEETLLYNKFFMTCCTPSNFEKLLTYDLELFVKVIRKSELTDVYDNNFDVSKKGIAGYDLTGYILLENTILNFLKYIKKYDIKDQYLMDKPFIAIANNSLAESFFKVYDANVKRLLKNSEIIDNYISSRQNLNDLLILLKITGGLEDDSIIRQRATTFITEKMFLKNLDDGTLNNYRIVGDDIHRIFNFSFVREEFDLEFANFFLENFYDLIDTEKEKSGIIERIYLNFKEISRTCTSNKGEQRKLKVTLEKCLNYLSKTKFDCVDEETLELASLIGLWYDKNETWLNALKIYNESLKAPRNIFTKAIVESDGTVVYDNNFDNDLKENISNDYSYEWLPKQSYDNLVLGKYCNCCAHVDGAGAGIMRASMILDCCQNLVIRNEVGEIIAKSTIYVNKGARYAVFNNVETSLNYREDEKLKKIYKAFLRGTKKFIEVYNRNNEEIPINEVSVGTNRNSILTFLDDVKHPSIPIKEAINYGGYSLTGSGYRGDWFKEQRLVLKR